ncbi:MAG: AAA family ATPase [Infirmifilum sp.]
MNVLDVLGILQLPTVSHMEAHTVPQHKLVLQSNVGPIDVLLDGGFQTGCLYDVAGEAGSGKTQLCMQLAVNAQKPVGQGGLGSRVVFVDTTGDFSPERVVMMAAARDLDPSSVLAGILYVRAHSLQHLLVLLEKAFKEVVAGDVGLLILDELTRLVRTEALSARERTEAYAKVIYSLWRVARAGAVVIATRQVVQSDGIRPAGGAALDTYACLTLLLRKRGVVREAEVLSTPWKRGTATFRIGEHGVEEA